MPADRLLGTLLRALQSQDENDTQRLLGTAASLLVTLNNPLNVTLLVNRLSTSPALWQRPDGLRFAQRFMAVFHSAVPRVVERVIEEAERQRNNKRSYQLPAEPQIPLQRWIAAVLEGLDVRSPRSRHLLVTGGLLVSLAGQDRDLVPHSSVATIQETFVKAANVALVHRGEDELGRMIVVLATNHTFPHLSDFERTQINYDELLPVSVNSLLASTEGLGSGYFLGAIDADVRQSSPNQFDWPASSESYQRVSSLLSSPLVTTMGPLSRLIAHAVENVQDPWLVSALVDDVAEFTKTLYKQWRINKLSEVDAAEESLYLLQEARQTTLPELWRLLRSSMFALVILLRSAVGRLLADGTLAADSLAPKIATQSLIALQNLNFIFARLGTAAFSQYTFVHLTSIDILNSYRRAASTLLKTIAPAQIGQIPAHPLDRTSDLFFLNTAEHFTLVIPTDEAETLLVASATPYLTSKPTPELTAIFEAAHSLMLAVFAAPQNGELTSRHLPYYVEALFNVFPQNLSPRQFRLALRNLVRVVSPPSDMAAHQPLLAGILLEILRDRAIHAPGTLLPSQSPAGLEGGIQGAPLSEQAVLILTLIDALPYIEITLLQEWLPLLPEVLASVEDDRMKADCVSHLWETMVGGSMDPERSQVCVGWWTTAGGMDAVLYGGRTEDGKYTMAGALPAPPPSKM